MIFNVHCDESGKLKNTACVVFAASHFRSDEMASFNRQWQGRLKDAGVRYLHMKDAMRFGGEFSGWMDRDSDRDEFLETLATLVCQRADYHTLAIMNSEQFGALPIDERRRLKDPVYAGFDGLLKNIVSDASRFGARDYQFNLVYDMAEEYSDRVLKMFVKQRRLGSAYHRFFPSLTFADDEMSPPLQAVDMIAYCQREEVEQGARARPIVKRIMEVLRSGDSSHSIERA